MARITALLLCALSAWQIGAQDIIPPCIPACVNQVRTQFAEYGCTNANDAGCLCWKADFSYGIRDCGVSCGANDGNVRQHLVGAFCAGILTAQPESHSATGAASSLSTIAPSTAPSTQPSPVSASLSASQSTFSTATPMATASSSSVAPATTHSLSSSTSATEAPTHTTSDTEPSLTSTTTFDPAPETSSASATSSPPPGLSSAAAAGIGVGVGAAFIAMAAIGICFFIRRRKRNETVDISKPLPGSSRAYPPSREVGSMEKYGNDIEMTSNRYEDMVPRQQPRTMV